MEVQRTAFRGTHAGHADPQVKLDCNGQRIQAGTDIRNRSRHHNLSAFHFRQTHNSPFRTCLLSCILRTMSGSFKTCPVRIAITWASQEISPLSRKRRIPASVVADAGSQPIPSRPITALASRIFSSSTSSTMPFVNLSTCNAFRQERGEPMEIAVAQVLGLLTMVSDCKPDSTVRTRGFAPEACTITILGTLEINPAA